MSAFFMAASTAVPLVWLSNTPSVPVNAATVSTPPSFHTKGAPPDAALPRPFGFDGGGADTTASTPTGTTGGSALDNCVDLT